MMKTFTKFLMGFGFLALSLAARGQNVVYVNAASAAVTPDGNSWATAFTNLQDAIDAASTGKQVWVAAGIYKPTKVLGNGADNRDKTFALKAGVAVYGGFAGTEAETFDLSTRNFVLNETTLSGDLDNNDNLDGTIVGSNAYHIAVSYNNDETSVLDGFTLKGGNANGTVVNNDLGAAYPISRDAGGAIFCRRSSSTLRNLKVVFNQAVSYAAGIYLGGPKAGAANQLIEKSTFTNNQTSSVTNYRGGAAIFIAGYSTAVHTPQLNELTFTANSSANYGGAVYASSYTEPTLSNSAFSGNQAAVHGGAVYIYGASASYTKVTIQNSTFTNNKGATLSATAGNGGAIHVNIFSELTLSGSSFQENESRWGGALYIAGSSSAEKSKLSIARTQFTKNLAYENGGAVNLNSNSENTLSNVIFSENVSNGSAGAVFLTGSTNLNAIANAVFYKNDAKSATNGGGAIMNSGAVLDIFNATFYLNTASNATGLGGALMCSNSANTNTSVYNAILLGNTASDGDDVYNGADATLNIQNAITQGATGTNVIANTDAATVFLSTDVNSGDFLKLNPISTNPAINGGDDALVPPPITIDLAGLGRFNGTVDLGAYENFSTLPIKLLSFTAKNAKNAVQVNWLTETETDNDYFLLERSSDGINYALLKKEFSKGSTGFAYAYTDYRPLNGTSYYKLTQVDKDGVRVSFEPVVVNYSLNAQAELVAYPNPAVGGKVTVTLGNRSFDKLELINLSGQKLQSLNILPSDTDKVIDVSSYPSGIYLLRLSNGDDALLKKIIKP